VATTLELKIVIPNMSENPPELPEPVPIPQPDRELVASMSESEIRRDLISDQDSEPRAHPALIAEPPELFTTTAEFEIVRSLMAEIPLSSQIPVPIPESGPELLTSIYERESNIDPIEDLDSKPNARPAPMPEPSALFTKTVEFEIKRLLMAEMPVSSQIPVPTPELDSETVTSMREFDIRTPPIDDIDPPS
jgi:hypothetical protein